MKNIKKEKTCPGCNEIFYCTESENCWCFDIEMNEDIRKYIAENYSNCLCKKCLESIINKNNK